MTNTSPSGADALREYANPLNWDVDVNGIRRVWREPGSTTPDAYNGFELARAALSAAQDAPQPATQQGIDERGAFESIFKSDCGVTFDRDENGFYKSVFVSEAWKVWQARAALAAQAQEAAPAAQGEPSDPTKDDLADPIFEAIWQAIKRWDLSRDGGPAGYAGATGTDVMTILNAIRPAIASWAAERWHAEVANRPLVNVHRRTLDDTWRQVIRRFGVDAEARLGPAHDELVARAAQQEGGE